MAFWKHKYLKFTVLSIILILLFAFINTNNRNLDYPYAHYIRGDTITCAVLLDQSLKSTGYSIGYIYEIFKNLEYNQKCEIALSLESDAAEQWDKLINGNTDMLIINSIKDTVPESYQDNVISSIPLNKNEDVCVVTKDNYKIIQAINYWLTFYMQDPAFAAITKSYYKNSKRSKNTEYISYHSISPYDDLIKKYSEIIDWDWRLLSALIYQESKFKVGVSSSRGAIGLMQIREDVANTYGIQDIYEPEQNILAGVYHIRRLQNMYKKMGVDSVNLVKITLAAYNCGEGRLDDCMKVAKSEGKNPLVWEDIENIIPLMSEKEYMRRDDIKLGRFRGKETIKYVNRILERYDMYKETIAPK